MALNARMTELGKSLPAFKLLQTIPGIGGSTAIRLISELGDMRRFNTRQQLNSYVGIDTTEVDSGVWRPSISASYHETRQSTRP